MSAAEVAAVVARLESAGAYAHDANPEDDPDLTVVYPYTVVYGGAGVGTSDRECDSRVTEVIDFQTVTVGKTPGQCRTLADHHVGLLTDHELVVAGRYCHKLSHEGSQPVRPDKELPDRVLFIATNQWRVVSDPV